jgi:hypothetical protein
MRLQQVLARGIRVTTRSWLVLTGLSGEAACIHLSILSSWGVRWLVERSLGLEHAGWWLSHRLRSGQLLDFKDVAVVVMVEMMMEVLLLVMIIVVQHVLSHCLRDFV